MNSVAIPRIPGENIGGICRLVDEKGHSLTLNVAWLFIEWLHVAFVSPARLLAATKTHLYMFFLAVGRFSML